MGTTPALAAGEEFVAGRSQAKAKELVLLAEAAGLKGSVKTTYNGYIFPSAILAGFSPEDALIGGTVVDESSDDRDVDPKVLAELEAEKAAADENPKGVEYDPSAATVDEVKEYFANANVEERARVLEVEAASAKPRKGILDLATIPEGAK